MVLAPDLVIPGISGTRGQGVEGSGGNQENRRLQKLHESFIGLSISNSARYFAQEKLLMIFLHPEPLNPRIPDPTDYYLGKCDVLIS